MYFLSVLWTVLSSTEDAPNDMQAFEAERAANKGLINAMKEILGGFFKMPKTMVQLAVVQFFTWLPCSQCGSTPPSITEGVFHTTDGRSLLPIKSW